MLEMGHTLEKRRDTHDLGFVGSRVALLGWAQLLPPPPPVLLNGGQRVMGCGIKSQ